MSTERSFRREAGPSTRGFRLTIVASIAVLSLAIAGLVAVTIGRGPSIRSAELSVAGLVEREGQRIRLHLDQTVGADAADRVRVSPAAAHEVELDGTALTLTFDDPLRYATEYTVSVPGARSDSTGVVADLDYSFTTEDPPLYSLERAVADPGAGADATPDVIRSRTVAGGSGEVVFRAPRIVDYVVVGPVLVVLELLDDDTNALTTVSLTTGERGIIPLPGPGTVGSLRAQLTAQLVAYTFTSAETDAVPGSVGSGPASYSDALFFYDLTDQEAEPRGVTGLDGSPLQAVDWAFVPRSTSVVAQTPDQAVLRVDLLAPDSPVPLGQHAELRGFVPGSSRLVVADPESGSTIDLDTGETTTLALPFADLGPSAYPGRLLLLSGERYVQVFTDYPEGSSTARSLVVEVDGAVAGSQPETGATSLVYEPAVAGTRIQEACLSPNGQFVSVETVPAGAPADRYPGVPGYAGTTTVLVDLQTGSSSRSVAGISRDWC